MRLKRFLLLPYPEKKLIVRAAALLIVLRFGLSVFSLPRTQRILKAFSRPRRPEKETPEAIAGVVERCSRHLPVKTTCLTRALTAQTLLARSGISSRLQIGVRKDDGGLLEAHAWVEQDGRILIGSGDDGRGWGYSPILEWSPSTGRSVSRPRRDSAP